MHLLEPETPDALLDVGARDEHSQLGDGFMVLKDYAVITYVGRYRCVLSLWALDWFCGLGRGRGTGTVVVCLSVGFSGGAECSNFVRCFTRLELKPTGTNKSSRLRAKNCTLGYEQRRLGVGLSIVKPTTPSFALCKYITYMYIYLTIMHYRFNNSTINTM